MESVASDCGKFRGKKIALARRQAAPERTEAGCESGKAGGRRDKSSKMKGAKKKYTRYPRDEADE